MEIKRVPFNDRFSAASVFNGTVYLTGITSRKEGIEEQTKEVLSVIEERLAAAGSDKDHILRVEIFLKDMKYFDEMNAIYDAWVSKTSKPCRFCVTADMSREATLLEVVVTAAEK